MPLVYPCQKVEKPQMFSLPTVDRGWEIDRHDVRLVKMLAVEPFKVVWEGT